MNALPKFKFVGFKFISLQKRERERIISLKTPFCETIGFG